MDAISEAPPERIYGWLDSQLSIARHYGGLQYAGHMYFVAPDEDDQPLVRADVLTREAKERAAAQKAAREAEEWDAANAQDKPPACGSA